MSLTFTRRANGTLVTIATDHVIGGEEIATMLARFSSAGFGYEPGDRLSKTRIEKLVRQFLTAFGDDAYSRYWEDSHSDAELAELYLWAYRQVENMPDAMTPQLLTARDAWLHIHRAIQREAEAVEAAPMAQRRRRLDRVDERLVSAWEQVCPVDGTVLQFDAGTALGFCSQCEKEYAPCTAEEVSS